MLIWPVGQIHNLGNSDPSIIQSWGGSTSNTMSFKDRSINTWGLKNSLDPSAQRGSRHEGSWGLISEINNLEIQAPFLFLVFSVRQMYSSRVVFGHNEMLEGKEGKNTSNFFPGREVLSLSEMQNFIASSRITILFKSRDQMVCFRWAETKEHIVTVVKVNLRLT